MRVLAWVALALILLLILAFVARVWLITHGHINERLDVTVRVVDSESGRPLGDAVVAVIRYSSLLERDDLEWHLAEALEYSQRSDNWSTFSVFAKRTTGEPVTEMVSEVYVTRWWVGGLQVSKEVYSPRVLLVDHPKHGRTIIPIDPEAPLSEGDEPNTWRLDLGTVRVP